MMYAIFDLLASRAWLVISAYFAALGYISFSANNWNTGVLLLGLAIYEWRVHIRDEQLRTMNHSMAHLSSDSLDLALHYKKTSDDPKAKAFLDHWFHGV